MVTEHLEDGEGELLRRVRELIGPEKPLVASLDLHSNTTPEMIANADLLVAYRTYPHIDMADTGARTARLLDEMLRRGRKPDKAFQQIPFLIPLNWQCTMMQPAEGIYQRLADMETGDVMHTSFTPGFPAADIHHCGPSVFTYAWTEEAARASCQQLADDVNGLESDFAGTIYSPDDGVREAMRLAERATRPIVIADTQDNPGAGGDSNTAGMLRALVENRAKGAALGLMADPAAAEIVHRAGAGSQVNLSFGGHSGVDGDPLSRRSIRSRACMTADSMPRVPSTRVRSSISDPRPASRSAARVSYWPATRCNWPTRRCTVSSASNRPSRTSWSTKVPSTSAPTSPPSPRKSSSAPPLGR